MKASILCTFLLLSCSLCLALQPLSIQEFVSNIKGNGFQASAVKINGTLPLGTPLAGYNHGARRVPYWPIPVPRKYTTWMEPSVGVLDTSWVKALVMDDGNGERIAFVTMDAIGADAGVSELGWTLAAAQGLTIPREKVVFSASHSHSGPGAVSTSFLWQIAPAVDLLVPSLQYQYAGYLAEALLTAEKTLQPAKIDIGVGQLVGVTQNRRAPNPWVQKDTIDANLGVIRVDDIKGNSIATLWNFATHGTCYGPANMMFSSDIAGASCDAVESLVGGVALFVNADAGDIVPTGATCGCHEGVCKFPGAAKIAAAVEQVHKSLNPSNSVTISSASQIVPFGMTNLNLTLARIGNCTKGGPLNICTICNFLRCDANIHLPESWVEENPRFTAFRFDINGKSTGMVTIPGEGLIELGWWIRNDTKDLGFDQTFLLGYSNGHMGYFATPNEYDWGGYESELTFWGIGTAGKIRDGCKLVAQQVKPSKKK